MEKRFHLYVSKKHPALWLTGLLMLLSVAARIAVFSQMDGTRVWQQVVWPAVAVILFVLMIFISGKERLYKTAIPVWMLGLWGVWQLHYVLAGKLLWYVLACICILFFCVNYTTIIAGRHKPWLLFPLYLLGLGVIAHIHRQRLAQSLSVEVLFPGYLLIAGLLVMLFAIKIHADGKYHPTWKDRPDGRYIRSSSAIEQITPFIMPQRCGANILFEESVEITQLDRYIRAKRREGMPSFGATHAIIAAYLRTVAKYPALNRFVAGQRIYSRGEDVVICITVKKEMTKQSPDTVIKLHFHPGDTAKDVYEKFNAAVASAKDEMENSNIDDAAGFLTATPRMVLKAVVWLVRCLDYFGMAPKFLLEVSPFHGSIYFTSMGSLGIRPVYHHLYDFGTVPVFCAFGRKRRAEEIKDGQLVERKYMDLRFNVDERICDGFYYASLIRYFLRLLTHPEELDRPPETIEQDIP
ncbi:MAG: hypothetical protein IJB91_06935 [Oscillospiraceae bacterium]|nr:hypothetical protein [Oscillospiraceae bacterium]